MLITFIFLVQGPFSGWGGDTMRWHNLGLFFPPCYLEEIPSFISTCYWESQRKPPHSQSHPSLPKLSQHTFAFMSFHFSFFLHFIVTELQSSWHSSVISERVRAHRHNFRRTRGLLSSHEDEFILQKSLDVLEKSPASALSVTHRHKQVNCSLQSWKTAMKQ